MKMITGQRCDGGLRPKEAYVDAGSMTWRYLEWGDRGLPLVLWHGITDNAREWWRVGPFLAGIGFHVWAPDLPGHGDSDDAPEGYAVDRTARLLDTWLAALKLDAPIVMGHSWGGLNALIHATLPDAHVHARALILEDPPLQLSDDPNRYLPSFTDGLGTPPDDASVAAIVDANPRWHPCDAWWKAEARQYARPAAIEGFFRQNAGLHVVDRLGQLAVPTQLLLGDHVAGGIFTSEHIEELKTVDMLYVTMEIIENSSHSMHRDSFVPFCMALGAWIRQFMKQRG